MDSTRASPACGPSDIATATARFSSTTGPGAKRANSGYSRAICGRSVAPAPGAEA